MEAGKGRKGYRPAGSTLGIGWLVPVEVGGDIHPAREMQKYQAMENLERDVSQSLAKAQRRQVSCLLLHSL